MLVNPQVVFHLAAQPLILEGYKKPYLTYTVNAIGTLNILEVCKAIKICKVINMYYIR